MRNQLTAGLCILLLATTSVTVADSVPFVPAFDRFSQHGDANSLVSGRLLLTELSCTACHDTESKGMDPKGGPNLNAAGSRLQEEWIREFLLNPQHAKPGTTMPSMLGGLPESERTTAAAALAAFLKSLQQPFPEIKATGANPVPREFWNHGDADAGRAMYHQIGCIACHEPDEKYEVAKMPPSPTDKMLEQLDPEDIEELGLAAAARRVNSVPHAKLHEKYTRKSLTFFVLNPERVRPSGRMPNFGLKAVDAANIAAYLMAEVKNRQELPANDTLIADGRRLFRDLNCVACHAADGFKAQVSRTLGALKPDSDNGCCVSPTSAQPHFELSEKQRSMIKEAIQNAGKAPLVKEQQLHLSLMTSNCYACHERGKRGGVGRFRKPYFETVGHIDIGDEGRLPPPLTGVGGKLKGKWLDRVLKNRAAIRSHMHVRMPQFPATSVNTLLELFASVDHPGTQPKAENVFGDVSKLAANGRRLMDAGCVQCHAFKGESLPGTVGIDLNGVANRVHPEWLHDFLLNPVSLKARTRMPTFFPGGLSRNHDVLNGDTELQIAAMWAYLSDINKQPLPEKIVTARNQDYELVPKDRPLILRTFMPEAGTHAIAVGLPGKVSFAFDAEHSRLAQIWRGRFLDAQGTWFVRSAPPAKPLSSDQFSLPPGCSFVFSDELPKSPKTWSEAAVANSPVFRGYRLDKQGMPAFRYEIGQTHFEEQMRIETNGSLTRSIKLDGGGSRNHRLWIRPLLGKSIVRHTKNSCSNEAGQTVSVRGINPNANSISEIDKDDSWILEVPLKGESILLELNYQWKGENKQ